MESDEGKVLWEERLKITDLSRSKMDFDFSE